VRSVLVTGAQGFIGRNLVAHLAQLKDWEIRRYDLDDDEADLRRWLSQVDVVFHLAGVNRPENTGDYETGNAGFTRRICDLLREMGRKPKIVMSSSIQAELANPYGISKRRAEEALQAFSRESGAPVSIYRLKNVFGKWCRPNYNSVTATFCHNIAHDLPISISDPNHEVGLIYVDDVATRFLSELQDAGASADGLASDTIPSYRITLGDLAGRIQVFHEMKSALIVPDFEVRFNQCLYATYLSYVAPPMLAYGLEIKADARGSLAEFIKSPHFGQVFLSRTRPGVTRGNHYHHSKTEKFLVLAGTGVIRMRPIEGDAVAEYRVCGEDYRVVDIPPGHTHSITNVGGDELVTLFWASEIFNPDRPDTYYLDVTSVNSMVDRKI
jgi:UDP-2-acetamido-2,6-beta-L-arabino-hexul-4-ose reductase